MTDLKELLEARGIRKAVVIDDVFDDVPRPEELNEGDWSIFFDDLSDEEKELLKTLHEGYEEASTDDLKASPEFIAVVWQNRENLPQAREHLFREYEQTKATERGGLDALVAALEALELTCTTMGRDLVAEAREAELIFIDLFLGFQQSEDDMTRAIQRVGELVEGRFANPPLVVLMSRSPRLQDKRNEFRDTAGLLGSTFRVVSKTDLAKDGTLDTLLTRLANHYEDAKRVAGFVHAWDSGLDQARQNFIGILRRLDLSDLAQVRALLLDFEGQNLGEYLLDVADRVLQHEIEDDDTTIAAALELNKIDLAKYPAPHLVGSPDLQELVHRMVFLHPDRLQLSEDNGKVQLQFGDVLRWKTEDGSQYSDDVSLVVSPACDLVRDGGTERVMLLSGKLEELQPRNWSYKAGPVRTAIVILPGEGRKWIRWNLKNIQSLDWDELGKFFGEEEKVRRIGRLREIYAIEIQQMLLADLGRIGRPANLPVPFPVSVSLFYVDAEAKARRLEVEAIESAACYVGRGERPEPVHRLVLPEQACDHIEQALHALDRDAVHNSAKASLDAVKGDKGFFTRFERGEIEMSDDKGTKEIKGDGNQVYAVIMRGQEFDEGSDVTGNSRKAALIVKISDIQSSANE
ncbi:hypothetical protein [uncultured Rhodospira sp.]|uniref:hypothetical protein n=1 Tax=uncultured Rhodospira sp. TaxID=1936189 RepID=UPI00262684FC|nr:hypothetical protein [uncultured Rhodospira sp.]